MVEYKTELSSLPKNTKFPLGSMFSGYENVPERIYYDPDTNMVKQLVFVRTARMSARGYAGIDLPQSVKTVGKLIAYLAKVKGLRPLLPLSLFCEGNNKTITINKREVAVGRASVNDLRFERFPWHRYLGREQAVFKREEEHWFITHLGSDCQTWFNGEILQPHQTTLIKPGDSIRFTENGDVFIYKPLD